MVPREAEELVKPFEGFRSAPYLCPAGVWTYGYGSTRDAAGQPVTANHPPILHEEAMALLRRDLAGACTQVVNLTTPELSQPRLGALTSFTYNLGGGAYRSSTLRKKVNSGLHDEVPGQLRRWVTAGGLRLPGLVLRREAEAAVYMRG